MVAEEHAHDLGVAEGQVCDESDGFAVSLAKQRPWVGVSLVHVGEHWVPFDST